MRVLLLINPGASRARGRVDEIKSFFERRADTHTVVTNSEDEIHPALRKFGPDADRIVLGGGDGTLSHCLPELIALNKPFAVLPVGTANDFARTISVPLDLAQASSIALDGIPRKIDLGLVNGHHFLNVASVGVASRVTAAQTPRMKKLWRALSYVVSLREAVRGMKPFTANIEIDGVQNWSGKVYQVSVGNGRFHGGGMTVSEAAALDDDMLHLYFILAGSFWQIVWGLLNLRLGRPADADVLGLREGRTITVTTRRSMPINADGEIVTETPATFTVLPDALVVMTPAELPQNQKGLARPAGGRR